MTVIDFEAQGRISERCCSESCVLPPMQPQTEEPTTNVLITPTPRSQCPEKIRPPKKGHVTVEGNIVGYRCNLGYRIDGNDTRECINGDILGQRPKCRKANLNNGRCFVSHGNCTDCFSGSMLCSAKQLRRIECPPFTYCRRVGPGRNPTCCEMNIDMFGRCREACP
jgi:hypothetical protein